MSRARVKRPAEPKLLIALRILVFAFIPICGADELFATSIFELLFIFGWGVLFMFGAPLLLILEVVGLFEVLKHPELASDSGKWFYHVISLCAYGAIVLVLFTVFCK